MLDLDTEVQRWRERQERNSSLSPRELDELEDHLRARVDIELELNAVLAPERAFAIARHDLGEAAALSKEFAKAGRPRWRRWLVAGWSMYAASWFLPIFDMGWLGTLTGQDMLGEMARGLPDSTLVLAVNLPMLMTVSVLWGARISGNRWFRRLVGAAGVTAIGGLAGVMVYGSIENGSISWLLSPLPIRMGFWAWTVSFLCVARGLRLRAKAWASARTDKAPA